MRSLCIAATFLAFAFAFVWLGSALERSARGEFNWIDAVLPLSFGAIGLLATFVDAWLRVLEKRYEAVCRQRDSFEMWLKACEKHR